MTRTPSVGTTAEPAPGEIDRMLGELEASWKATITIRRQAPNDVGYRLRAPDSGLRGSRSRP